MNTKRIICTVCAITAFTAATQYVNGVQRQRLKDTINLQNERIVAMEKQIDTYKRVNIKIIEKHDIVTVPAIEYHFKYNSAAAPEYDVPLSKELQNYTYNMCRYYGIEDNYRLVLALMWQESGFDAAAQSPTNDYGLMQINECNRDNLQEVLGVTNLLDAKDNIYSGVYILSNLLNEYNDAHKALMAYNMGPSGAEALWERGIYTSNYSEGVVSKMHKLKLVQTSKK